MKDTKSAFIAIIGRPNVGKSSIINALIKQKIAIVSDKPQTTRTRIMGVLTKNENQFVFVDTPGFHKPKNVLGQNMMKAVGNGLSDVNAAMLVVEAAPKFTFDKDNLPQAEIELINEIKRRKLKAILVINKIDLLQDKEDLFEIIAAYNNGIKTVYVPEENQKDLFEVPEQIINDMEIKLVSNYETIYDEVFRKNNVG